MAATTPTARNTPELVQARREVCGPLADALNPLAEWDQDDMRRAALLACVGNSGSASEAEIDYAVRVFQRLIADAALLRLFLLGSAVFRGEGDRIGMVAASPLARATIPAATPDEAADYFTDRWLGLLEIPPEPEKGA